MLSVILLDVANKPLMLSVTMLNVVILSVVILSVVHHVKAILTDGEGSVQLISLG